MTTPSDAVPAARQVTGATDPQDKGSDAAAMGDTDRRFHGGRLPSGRGAITA